MNLKRMLTIAVCSGLVFGQPVFANSATVDSLGIELGMSPDQVLGQLKRINPDFVIVQFNYASEPGVPTALGRIIACTPNMTRKGELCRSMNPRQEADQILIAFGGSTGKAFFIRRQWRPASDKLPLAATATQPIFDKYGDLTTSGHETARSSEGFSRVLQRHTTIPGRKKSNCAVPLNGTVPGAAYDSMDACEVSVGLRLLLVENPDRLRGFDLELFSPQVLVEDAALSGTRREAEEQRKRKELEDAARPHGAPKL